jgi:hypothetical protein
MAAGRGLVLPALLAATAGVARAEGDVCGGDAPPIAVLVEGATPELERAIFVDLAAELARTDLCARLEAGASPDARGAGRERAIARVTIRISPEGVAAVHIDDAMTQKRLERAVDVSGLKDDGRALALAIAADELLRASWVEPTLRRRAAMASAAPAPAAAGGVREAPGAGGGADRRATEIGVRATVAAYGGGQVQLGGALLLRRDVLPWLAGSVFVYAREALPASAALGTVFGHAAGGGASLSAYVARTGRARLGVEAAVEAGYVLFEGRAEEGASASRFGGPTAFGALGVTADVDVRPVRFGVSVGALAPFMMVEALAGDAVVTSMGGPGMLAALGAGVVF